jgi:hypothetical protein
VLCDLGNSHANGVGRCGLRREQTKTIGDQMALLGVDDCTLDASATDIDTQNLHPSVSSPVDEGVCHAPGTAVPGEA